MYQRKFAALLWVAWVAGCNGTIGPGSDPPRTDGIIDPPGMPPPNGTSCTPGNGPAFTRLVRLTNMQYDNSIRDLTGLDLGLGRDFLVDQNQAGFNRGVDLQVDDARGKNYRSAAEQLAAAVVASAAAYQKVVGCDTSAGDACARTFIAEFGKKAFRRPLSDAEKTSYLQLFNMGPALVETGDNFRKGVQITLEGLLQSPNFLYRVELSNQGGGGLIALTSHLIAARLSVALLNTTPHHILLAAAAANALVTAESVAAQARRLLDTPAARETMRDFHHQWLDLDIYENKLTKDQTLFPGVTPELAPALTLEVELFVDTVTFGMGRGLTSLLTAPFSFVNRTTAPLYGLTGTFGDSLQRVDLNPSQRAGLITQVGFLASHAFSNLSSPIHRGVFIQRRLLCTNIPMPPPDVPELPPLDGTTIKTTRQQVDMHTAPDACSNCHHNVINPPGFGLENYDAAGRYRTTENGEPIDATGALVATAGKAPFSNGVEMAAAIAASPEARACYATNWVRYVFGRAETIGDSCAIAQLSTFLSDDSYDATDLLVDMTRTKAFMFRTEGN